jgi:hypothetical protein
LFQRRNSKSELNRLHFSSDHDVLLIGEYSASSECRGICSTLHSLFSFKEKGFASWLSNSLSPTVVQFTLPPFVLLTCPPSPTSFRSPSSSSLVQARVSGVTPAPVRAIPTWFTWSRSRPSSLHSQFTPCSSHFLSPSLLSFSPASPSPSFCSPCHPGPLRPLFCHFFLATPSQLPSLASLFIFVQWQVKDPEVRQLQRRIGGDKREKNVERRRVSANEKRAARCWKAAEHRTVQEGIDGRCEQDNKNKRVGQDGPSRDLDIKKLFERTKDQSRGSRTPD